MSCVFVNILAKLLEISLIHAQLLLFWLEIDLLHYETIVKNAHGVNKEIFVHAVYVFHICLIV